MEKMVNIFILLLFPFSNVLGTESFFNDKERGWFWYEQKEEIKKDEKKEEKPQVVQQASLSAREVLKKQGEDWENALAKAILEPRKENIVSYLENTQKINDQAQTFSIAFRDAIWTSPQYDLNIKNPNNPDAIVAKSEETNKKTDETIEMIAKNHGIIFYFDDKCHVCHRFAPILKDFQNRYKFSVIATSNSGIGLQEYPEVKRNVNFGGKINVKYFPSTYLVEPEKGKITPISYGYSDYTSLQQKVLAAYERLKNGK